MTYLILREYNSKNLRQGDCIVIPPQGLQTACRIPYNDNKFEEKKFFCTATISNIQFSH